MTECSYAKKTGFTTSHHSNNTMTNAEPNQHFTGGKTHQDLAKQASAIVVNTYSIMAMSNTHHKAGIAIQIVFQMLRQLLTAHLQKDQKNSNFQRLVRL